MSPDGASDLGGILETPSGASAFEGSSSTSTKRVGLSWASAASSGADDADAEGLKPCEVIEVVPAALDEAVAVPPTSSPGEEGAGSESESPGME